MRRRDTFFQLCSWKMGLLGMPHRLVTWKHHIIIVEHRCARTRTYYPKNSKTAVKRVSLFFSVLLTNGMQSYEIFPCSYFMDYWKGGRKRMLSNEARKYTKISFQICCRTKRFWDRDHVFLWLVYISKEFSMQKAFFPTRCYCCASNAFLPYITVFLTKYMQGSKHAVISLLSKIRSEEGDFWKDLNFCVISKIYCNMNMAFQFPLLFSV